MKKIMFYLPMMVFMISFVSAKGMNSPKQTILDFYTAIDAGAIEKASEFLSEDVKVYLPFSPTAMDKMSYNQIRLAFKAGFPDMKHSVLETSESKGIISYKALFTGTNTGSLKGNPPTGNYVELPFLGFVKMNKSGKITELNVQFDLSNFNAQLMKGINPHAAAEASIRKAYSSLERKDFNAFASVCANDFTEKADPEPIVGVWNAIEYYKNFLSAFPDIKFTIESIVPAGDNTYYLKTLASGTNTGSFAGLPATGKYVSVPDVDIITMNAEGKCTSHSSINHNGMITAIGYGSLANPSNAVVMDVYEKFGKGDVPAILSVCSEDVLFDVHDRLFDTKARKFKGKAEVGSFFKELSIMFKYSKFQPTRFVADGDDVFVTIDVAYTHVPSGKNYSTNYTHQFKVVNGKIVYFRGMDSFQQMQ
ncbi:MAG: SnoaL-like domain-containing protein [Saprospiraceae bacterium]|nr:SnoaL-like domain-containing protein [Saprospiraceae bacterium]